MGASARMGTEVRGGSLAEGRGTYSDGGRSRKKQIERVNT